MLNITTIFIFLFVLNIFNVLNVFLRFIRALLKPERFSMGKIELLFFWISLSYIITFILQN